MQTRKAFKKKTNKKKVNSVTPSYDPHKIYLSIYHSIQNKVKN